MSGGDKMIPVWMGLVRMISITRYGHVVSIAILAGVFAWSGLHKIIDPAGFSLSVFRYHLLPYDAVNAVSLWIAGLELTCVVGLFIPRLRTAALWMLLCLLLVFSLGIGINLARGSQMACGCFSTSPMAHPIGWFGVLKNVGLMALIVYVLLTQLILKKPFLWNFPQPGCAQEDVQKEQ